MDIRSAEENEFILRSSSTTESGKAPPNGSLLMKKIDYVKYWFDLAQYDLKSAEAMLEGRRYLYVGFMCHQTIEKALKGLYVQEHTKVPPPIHNLIKLSKELSIQFPYDTKVFLEELNPLNIQARYPDIKKRISQILTRSQAIKILSKTKELYKCLTSRKK